MQDERWKEGQKDGHRKSTPIGISPIDRMEKSVLFILSVLLLPKLIIF